MTTMPTYVYALVLLLIFLPSFIDLGPTGNSIFETLFRVSVLLVYTLDAYFRFKTKITKASIVWIIFDIIVIISCILLLANIGPFIVI